MRTYLLIVLSYFVASQVMAQRVPAPKTIKNAAGVTEYFTYHANGKVSTRREMDSPARFNYCRKVFAFDALGNTLYEGTYGPCHGSGGVNFTFHTNGQIAALHRTFQPDGGIQYVDILYYYDDKGKLIRKEDNSLGNDGSPAMITVPYNPAKKD
jgi:hypothetical protein